MILFHHTINKMQEYYNGSIEKAEVGCMTEWFLDMGMGVKGIYWDVDETGYKAIFSIAETNNILDIGKSI